MFSNTIILALAATLPSAFSAPLPAPAVAHGPLNNTLSVQSAPVWYSGPYWNFPSMDTWISFNDMFDRNKNSMFANGDTGDDVGRIWNAIKDAATIGVDERVILGIIMQESHGDVGVRTTFSPEGIPTAGLMQCSGCQGFPGQHGLSQDQITAMVRGGTEHFKANLQHWGDQWATSSIYPALREYNSGNVCDQNDLSNGCNATPSYVSDISQRLQGWVD